MGYACPVCGAEQTDGVHLAHHLAVTASLGRADHEGWLETHAPEWAECDPAELADAVVEYAPEIETPEFESGPHDHAGAPTFEDDLAAQARGPGRGDLTAEAAAVLDEARDLTKRMQESSDADDADAGGNDADDAAADDADPEENG